MAKRRIILTLCGLYLLAFCVWIIHSALEGDSSAFPTLALTLVLGAFVCATSVSFHLKRAFLSAFEPDKWRSAKTDEFPLLEVAELDQLTREWEHLGFEPSRDQAMIGVKRMGTAFSRTFEHPTQGAVAIVMQQFLPLRTLPFTSNVSTCWGEREPVLDAARKVKLSESAPLASPTPLPTSDVEPDLQETLWVFTTHNHAPNKFWRIMRQKRLMSDRLPPESSPQELWSAHQERRFHLETRLQESHLTGELAPLLEAHGCALSARLSRQLKRTPAWKFGLAFISRAPIPAHYDGELPF